MKFRVDHDALASAVAWVARALPARPVVPVLSALRLEAGDRLSVSCFDYELSATASLEADVAEPGSVLVPGRLLAEIVRSLPGQPVEFSSDGDAVNLTCGSAEFALVPMPLSDYPALPAGPPQAGTLDGGDLAEAVGQVLPAASRDDTLPILTAVCVDIHGGLMTLAATDRYRLAVRDVSWEPVRGDMRSVALVPSRTLVDAARTLAPGVPVAVGFEAHAGTPAGTGTGENSAENAGRADLQPLEGMISFESSGRRLMGRLMAGEFIRYESRFPGAFGCRAEIPAASFTEAVRRVSLVAERATPVRLTFGSGRVIIEAQTEGRARAMETVTASFSGDEPSIAFNPHWLLDGLVAAAAGAGDGGPGQAGLIRLEFNSPVKPALITWAAAPGDEPRDPGQAHGPQTAVGPGARPAFRYLVVPLRSATRP